MINDGIFLVVGDVNGQSVLSAVCFQLGLWGTQITQTFSARIAPLGLSHKQVGLLAVVDVSLARSQRDIADRLNVAPSLVVALVDQLIALGAVTRERSQTDRRVQVVSITEDGRAMLAGAARVAAALDAELTQRLSPAGRDALATLLNELSDDPTGGHHQP